MSMITHNHHSSGFFLLNYLTKNPQEIFKMRYSLAGPQTDSHLDIFIPQFTLFYYKKWTHKYRNHRRNKASSKAVWQAVSPLQSQPETVRTFHATGISKWLWLQCRDRLSRMKEPKAGMRLAWWLLYMLLAHVGQNYIQIIVIL